MLACSYGEKMRPKVEVREGGNGFSRWLGDTFAFSSERLRCQWTSHHND